MVVCFVPWIRQCNFCKGNSSKFENFTKIDQFWASLKTLAILKQTKVNVSATKHHLKSQAHLGVAPAVRRIRFEGMRSTHQPHQNFVRERHRYDPHHQTERHARSNACSWQNWRVFLVKSLAIRGSRCGRNNLVWVGLAWLRMAWMICDWERICNCFVCMTVDSLEITERKSPWVLPYILEVNAAWKIWISATKLNRHGQDMQGINLFILKIFNMDKSSWLLIKYTLTNKKRQQNVCRWQIENSWHAKHQDITNTT